MNLDNHALDSEEPRHYRIKIQGHLDPRRSEWFENMMIAQLPNGTTILSGPLADRAAVYGLINKLRDMGLTLLSVEVFDSSAKR